MTEIRMNSEARLYQAIVWKQGAEQAGERVEILAEGLEEAEREIRERYGTGIAFSLYSQEDANKAR
jgi:Trp operon repressor